MIRSGDLVYWVNPTTEAKVLALVVRDQYEAQVLFESMTQCIIVVDLLCKDTIYKKVATKSLEKIRK